MLMRFGHKMDSSSKVSHSRKAGAGRIAKHMARAGVCSRRDAERLIADKRVTLNGAIVESPAVNVTDADIICVDGRRVAEAEKARLWRYHKVKGQVTTGHDPQGRETVFDRLPEDLPRLISIGRLDYNTEGLLLFTNDGALSRYLELPSTGWLRRYRVRVNGRPKPDALAALGNGIEIDGVRYGAIEARMDGREQTSANTWVTIGIREGKNREVRKVMDHLGLQVTRLIRVSFGPFALGEMPPGEIEEVKTRVLAEQLGAALAEEFGVKAAVAQAALRPEPRMHRTGFRADASGDASKRRPDGGAKRSNTPARSARPTGERAGGWTASAARPSRLSFGAETSALDQRREGAKPSAPAFERRRNSDAALGAKRATSRAGDTDRGSQFSRDRVGDSRPSAQSDAPRRSFMARARTDKALVRSADQAGERKPWAKDGDGTKTPAHQRSQSGVRREAPSGDAKPRRPAARDSAISPDQRQARPASPSWKKRDSDDRAAGSQRERFSKPATGERGRPPRSGGAEPREKLDDAGSATRTFRDRAPRTEGAGKNFAKKPETSGRFTGKTSGGLSTNARSPREPKPTGSSGNAAPPRRPRSIGDANPSGAFAKRGQPGGASKGGRMGKSPSGRPPRRES